MLRSKESGSAMAAEGAGSRHASIRSILARSSVTDAIPGACLVLALFAESEDALSWAWTPNVG